MLKFLNTVREDILKKDIYIWNVNVNSMRLLVHLVIMLIDIKGFVIPQKFGGGELSVLNLPLITIEEFNHRNNCVLITLEDCDTIKEYKNLINQQIFMYDEIFSINYEIFNKNIYIYGAGDGAKKVTDILFKQNININGYVTTDEPTTSKFYSFIKSVKKYNKKMFHKDDAIIVSVINYTYFSEILTNLSDVQCDVYVNKDIVINFIDSNAPCVLHQAIKDNKEVFLLSRKSIFTENIERFLKMLNINIINKNKYDFNTLYEFLEKNKNNFIVMINEFDNIKLCEFLDKLDMIGFSIKNKNIASLCPIIRSKTFLLKKYKEVHDNLIGYSYDYGYKENNGYKILGEFKNSHNNKPKILIYGGSTSTIELYDGENWTIKLYKKLKNMNVDCLMYVGAAGGYRIIHEFLRFLRDGHILKPDIVISMSGVNDTELTDLNNKFNLDIDIKNQTDYILGVPSNENCYDYWLRVVKMFNLYVKSLNGAFFPFLQPMNLWTPNATLETKMQCEYEGYMIGNKDYLNSATNSDIYTNLIDMFHNQPDMFIDDCHYSEKGAEILSDKVLEVILPTLSKARIYKKENCTQCAQFSNKNT